MISQQYNKDETFLYQQLRLAPDENVDSVIIKVLAINK